MLAQHVVISDVSYQPAMGVQQIELIGKLNRLIFADEWMGDEILISPITFNIQIKYQASFRFLDASLA